ncbi:MAG: 30S ribosomal protein S6 [Chloroflexi bacterium]|nr:30S ribosomal protein S6 [Chloroflexota bacterium]
MRDYELTVIISPEVEEDKVGGVVEQVSRILQTAKAETGDVNVWGRRRLAYAIQTSTGKFREGYYVTFPVKLEPSATSQIDRSLKLTEQIVRFLLVRKDE